MFVRNYKFKASLYKLSEKNKTGYSAKGSAREMEIYKQQSE